jgi:hypothetical protein
VEGPVRVDCMQNAISVCVMEVKRKTAGSVSENRPGPSDTKCVYKSTSVKDSMVEMFFRSMKNA